MRMSGSSTSLEDSPVEIGNILEEIRCNHEGIERLEQLVMQELEREETSRMEQLLQGQRLRSMTKSIILKTQKLVETYGDIGAIEDAISPLAFQSPSWVDVSSAFSRRLEEIIEYHRTHPCEAAPLVDSEALVKEEPETAFTGEDCFARYLEMHESESDEEDPLRRPTGWDGKPIPYWLYRLGLGERLPKPRALSQLTDQGTEGDQAPAGVAIPPPDIRIVLEKTVGILSRTRSEIERKIIGVYGEVAGFEFLNEGDIHHAFYQHRLTQDRLAGGGSQTYLPTPAVKSSRHGGGASQTYLAATLSRHGGGGPQTYLPATRSRRHGGSYGLRRVCPEPHKFTCRRPEWMTGKELDIIKLTAQFWALYGRSFWEGFRETRDKDPLFEFMKPGTGGVRFDVFIGLVEAYSKVVLVSRCELLKKRLMDNAADMKTVLKNCFRRLRLKWDVSAVFEKPISAKRARPLGPLPLAHLCMMASMALEPPPTTPDPKRRKIDESDLVPEDQFLAQHGSQGSATIWVSVPKVSGGLQFPIIMPSLSETVASLKDQIALEMEIPASRQKLSGKSGILEDNKSLAHYNVGPQDMLTLSQSVLKIC